MSTSNEGRNVKMLFRILKKDLKRKKVMNAILLCFILLATMFVASGISNVVSVMNGTDSYLDKAGIGDYVVISMGADSKASIDEILHEMESIRGNHVSMIFQDPMTSLNPVFTIEQQIRDPLMRHLGYTKEQARERALEMLQVVGIPSPESRLKQYPHELSGGLRQRVMIAIAMCCNPRLLIADEPTTALDVTVQAQILDLMRKMKDDSKTAVIMISHDLGVISSLCSRVIVMYGGLIVEEGLIDDLFYRTAHPYTAGLLASIPKGDGEKLVPINGTPPDLVNPPKGCPFAARCRYAMKLCEECMPPRYDLDSHHYCHCWLHHPSVEAKKGKVKLV